MPRPFLGDKFTHPMFSDEVMELYSYNKGEVEVGNSFVGDDGRPEVGGTYKIYELEDSVIVERKEYKLSEYISYLSSLITTHGDLPLYDGNACVGNLLRRSYPDYWGADTLEKDREGNVIGYFLGSDC